MSDKSKDNDKIPPQLSKEDLHLLKIDLKNEEKRILRQFNIDKITFSKYMEDIYILLSQNFATYGEAMGYFDKHIYKEIVDKATSGDL